MKASSEPRGDKQTMGLRGAEAYLKDKTKHEPLSTTPLQADILQYIYIHIYCKNRNTLKTYEHD